jgi:Zn-dependent protease
MSKPSPTVHHREADRGFRLGHIASVEIRLDWSLIIIFALITVNLSMGLFPYWHPEWSAVLHWTVALGAAVLFIASILVHEISHALVARTQEIPVSRITLFLFGGVAHMEKEPPSPKAEFLMAVIGPIVSIVIGAASTALGLWLAERGMSPLPGESSLPNVRSVGPLATLLLWLGPVNILLGVFNIIPGFPLDGGRVLRSILWALTDDLTKATRWAAGAGQALAWLLMAVGIFNLFGGALAQGIWLLLIGWFLNNAAQMSYQQLLLRNALQDVPITRVMRTSLATVSPATNVETLVQEYVMATEQQAFPVQVDGRLLGLVCLDDVRKIPHERWPYTTVAGIMTPLDEMSAMTRDETADHALEEFARRDVEQLPVMEDGHLLGLVRRADIVKWIALQGIGQ